MVELSEMEKLGLTRMSKVVDLRNGGQAPKSRAMDVLGGPSDPPGIHQTIFVEFAHYESAAKKIGMTDPYDYSAPHEIRKIVRELGIDLRPTPPAQPVAIQEAATPTFLSEIAVKAELAKTNLPDSAKEWLMESQYKDEAALKEAIGRATERVKKLTGSGQPFAQGQTTATQVAEVDVNKRLDEIDKRYGLR